jgi:lamin tail-like protein/CotH protein
MGGARRQRARLVGAVLAGTVLLVVALLQVGGRIERHPAPPLASSRATASAATSAAGNSLGAPRGPLVLSEVMPVNADVVFDETRKASDWIELHNRSDAPVRLGGWSLAQGRRTRGRWILPDVAVPPHGHLIVWASGRDLVGSAASRRVWLIVDRRASKHRVVDDRALALPTWTRPLRERSVRRVRVRVHVPEPGRYALWLTARALDSPRGDLRISVGSGRAVHVSIPAGDRARHLPVAAPERQADHALTAGVHEVDIGALAGRVEVRHVALVRAAGPEDPLGLHLHASFRLKRAGELVTLVDPLGRAQDEVLAPRLAAGLSYQRQAGSAVWHAGTPSPGGIAMLPAPDLSGQPSVSVTPLRVQLAPSPGVDALHHSRDGAIPTARHPRLDGPLRLTEPGVLRVRGFTAGRPVTPVTTRQFWIGPLPTEPVLMLALDPALLHDVELGILPNTEWHRRPRGADATLRRTLERQPPVSRPSPGRLWEPVAHLLVVDHTGAVHDGPVGLQRHSDDQLKVTARPSLGAHHLPATLLRPVLEPAPQALIIDPQDIGWVDHLVYDMIRAAGGTAPRSRVVHARFNGRIATEHRWLPGLAWLFETVDERFLQARWGHGDFDLVKGSPFRVLLGTAASFDRLVAWIERPDRTLAEAERLVDLDSLIILNFALVFLATQTLDGAQGYLAFDRSREPALLRPIAWDADHSFNDLRLDMLANWAPDLRHGQYGHHSRFLPVWVVLRLLEQDAAFRGRYLRQAERMLNHVFTLEWWRSRRGDFGWAEQPGVVERIESFLRDRPARVRESLSRHLRTPPPHRVRVAVRGPGRLLVDGFAHAGPYEGHYFQGGVLELDVPDTLRGAFRGLTVNGRPAGAIPYRRVVAEPLEIEAVFSE